MSYAATLLEPRHPASVAEALRRLRRLRPGERLEVRLDRGRTTYRVVPVAPPASPPKTASPAPAPAGARAPRGEVGYREVPRERVPYALVRAVEGELPRLCRVLGVPVPKLTYFRRAVGGETPDFTSQPVLGVCWPGAGIVGILKDLTPRQGVEVVAHELAHLRGDLDERDCRRAEALPWLSLGRLS